MLRLLTFASLIALTTAAWNHADSKWADCPAPGPSMNMSLASSQPEFIDIEYERCETNLFAAACEAYEGLDRYIYVSQFTEAGSTCQEVADAAANTTAEESDEEDEDDADEDEPEETYGTFGPWLFHDFSRCMPAVVGAMCHAVGERLHSQGVRAPYLTNPDGTVVPAEYPMPDAETLMTFLTACQPLAAELECGSIFKQAFPDAVTFGDIPYDARETLLIQDRKGTPEFVWNFGVPAGWGPTSLAATIRDSYDGCHPSNPHDKPGPAGETLIGGVLAKAGQGWGPDHEQKWVMTAEKQEFVDEAHDKPPYTVLQGYFRPTCDFVRSAINAGPCDGMYGSVKGCVEDCKGFFGAYSGYGAAYASCSHKGPHGWFNGTNTEPNHCAGPLALATGYYEDVVIDSVVDSSYEGFLEVVDQTLCEPAKIAAAKEMTKDMLTNSENALHNATLLEELKLAGAMYAMGAEMTCMGCIFFEPCLSGTDTFKLTKIEQDNVECAPVEVVTEADPTCTPSEGKSCEYTEDGTKTSEDSGQPYCGYKQVDSSCVAADPVSCPVAGTEMVTTYDCAATAAVSCAVDECGVKVDETCVDVAGKSGMPQYSCGEAGCESTPHRPWLQLHNGYVPTDDFHVLAATNLSGTMTEVIATGWNGKFPTSILHGGYSYGYCLGTGWTSVAPFKFYSWGVPKGTAMTTAEKCPCEGADWCETGFHFPTLWSKPMCNEWQVMLCGGERENKKDVAEVKKEEKSDEDEGPGPRKPFKCLFGYLGIICQYFSKEAVAGWFTVPVVADWCPEGCLKFGDACAPEDSSTTEGEYSDDNIKKACEDRKKLLKEGVDAGKIKTAEICPDMDVLERLINTIITIFVILIVCCCCCCIGCCYWKKCLCFAGGKGSVSPS